MPAPDMGAQVVYTFIAKNSYPKVGPMVVMAGAVGTSSCAVTRNFGRCFT